MSELQAELPDTRRDLFDLHDMFAGPRPFAFVGNAGSILDYDNGALIDSHDVVVRFNRTTTAGIEHKVGSRMDILCANLSNALEKAPSPAIALHPRGVVQFAISGPKDLEDGRPQAFRAWVGKIPLVITFAPDLIDFPVGARTRQRTPGTYALYAFPQLFRIERLFLTGFTMFALVGRILLKSYEAPRHRAWTTISIPRPRSSARSCGAFRAPWWPPLRSNSCWPVTGVTGSSEGLTVASIPAARNGPPGTYSAPASSCAGTLNKREPGCRSVRPIDEKWRWCMCGWPTMRYQWARCPGCPSAPACATTPPRWRAWRA